MSYNENNMMIGSMREGTAFARCTGGVALTTFLARILAPSGAPARELIPDPSKLAPKVAAAAAAEPHRLNESQKALNGALKRAGAGRIRHCLAVRDIHEARWAD